MSDIAEQAEALLATMKPMSASAGPGQNFLPPDTRRNIRDGDSDIPVWRAMDGPATLFVHGWDDTHRVWRQFAMHFLQTGKPVLLLDLPGHGASKAETCNWVSAGSAVETVCAEEGPVDAVIAHSFGCIAVVRALQLGADIPAIVLIAPPLAGNDSGWAARQRKEGVAEDVIEKARDIYQQRHGIPIEYPDFHATLAAYEGRILLVGSEADESCPLSGIRELADGLPNATLAEEIELDHRALALDQGILSQIRHFLAI